jgi:anti-sigma regulatory factor (Ser/Thr protein kinase)
MDSELANGGSLPVWDAEPCTRPDDLRARCRRQEVLVDRLSEAVATMRRGAKAMKAEINELRSETSRLHNYRRFPVSTARPMEDGELVEVALSLDVQAPGGARSVVTTCLRERVAQSALDSARLLVTELVSNSLRHSGSAGDQVVVSVELTLDWFRVGVLDSGSDAIIVPRPGNAETGGGFGLNLVRMLSERWGVEHLARGGTQVWAQLPRSAAGNPA